MPDPGKLPEGEGCGAFAPSTRSIFPPKFPLILSLDIGPNHPHHPWHKPMLTIRRESLQALLDIATTSMNFGSGFLCDDEVEVLREVAALLGIDPMDVTPANHECRYRVYHVVRDLRSYDHQLADFACTICTFTTSGFTPTPEAEDPTDWNGQKVWRVPAIMPNPAS